jgi:elongation factor 4
VQSWRRIRTPLPRIFGTCRGYAQAYRAPNELEKRIAAIPMDRFRNFCIVAHVDHGKSTLSDRLLELTGTIAVGGNKQILDKLDVERERGITVKAQTCTMIYNHDGDDYLLHLVDTPGHVDFRAEVSRSYASCGGALLLVDASQGVQAQTVANFYLAFAQGLTLVPVLNKVDLPHADTARVLEQIHDTFEIDPDTAVMVSAKTGHNVAALLPTVVEQIPAPVGRLDAPLRLLLVDSWYDVYKGVILLVRIFDGQVRAGDTIRSFATGIKYIVGEVGIQYPDQRPQTVLRAGQIGYIHFNPGMKRSQEAKVGDTYTTVGSEKLVEPLPGFVEPKSMVFVAAFPTDQDKHEYLEESINQIILNDRSVTLQKESSDALGAGWRLGFLGTLHCSVFEDRLRQEHGANIIITPPSVPFKVIWRDGKETIITNPNEFPDQDKAHQQVQEVHEPYVMATITLPADYLGEVIKRSQPRRAKGTHLLHRRAGHPQVPPPALAPRRRLLRQAQGRDQGVCLARLRGRGLPPLQHTKGPAPRQRRPRRCRLARHAYEPGRPRGPLVGREVQRVRRSADVRGRHPGSRRPAHRCQSDDQAVSQGRAGEAACQRSQPQAQAAREAEGGAEEAARCGQRGH